MMSEYPICAFLAAKSVCSDSAFIVDKYKQYVEQNGGVLFARCCWGWDAGGITINVFANSVCCGGDFTGLGVLFCGVGWGSVHAPGGPTG